MKKIYLISGIAMLSLAFNSCDNSNPKATDDKKETAIQSLKLAYVNIDSLQEGLDYFKQKREEFSKEEQAINNEINKLQRDIQSAVQNFQTKIQNRNISQEEAQQTEKRIGNMQMNLQKKQENLTSAFIKKQSKFNEDFVQLVDDFLVQYNKEKKYDFILSDGAVKSLLYHDPKYDITKELTQELNQWLNKQVKGDALDKLVNDTTSKP